MEVIKIAGVWTLTNPWDEYDIRAIAEDVYGGLALSEDDVMAILVHMKNNFDANDGLNWNAIELAIECVMDL